MPHIIVEYSRELDDHIEMSDLLKTMHEALAAEGINKARIKTRGIALKHVIVGDQGAAGEMLHATLLLLEGRDIAKKIVWRSIACGNEKGR